jgi:hypothetical protein
MALGPTPCGAVPAYSIDTVTGERSEAIGPHNSNPHNRKAPISEYAAVELVAATSILQMVSVVRTSPEAAAVEALNLKRCLFTIEVVIGGG